MPFKIKFGERPLDFAPYNSVSWYQHYTQQQRYDVCISWYSTVDLSIDDLLFSLFSSVYGIAWSDNPALQMRTSFLLISCVCLLQTNFMPMWFLVSPHVSLINGMVEKGIWISHMIYISWMVDIFMYIWYIYISWKVDQFQCTATCTRIKPMNVYNRL